ncbi:hypothetical protein OIDMADRAFT_23687 [Oidiodendron maius Zn]|uniref:CHAT domain-containing protein n=1 Tax=Oidiodendron maius (strain Zn) TaxID=913774 RepID=A0A0C3E3K2_OIDMZ|nr:hypothetical protein OIDMADRAFT_23687 [Oidiodendron maius Zn]
MDSGEGKQPASSNKIMVAMQFDETTKSSESYDDEEIKARQTDGVSSSSVAKYSDTQRRDEYGGNDDSDSLWEDVSDNEIDINSEETIEYIREVLDTTPQDDPRWADLMSGLGQVLFDRYLRMGEVVSLDEAIQIARQITNVIPDHHPERAGYLNSLGTRLGERYSRNGATADFEEAIRAIRQAADLPQGGDLESAGALYNLGMLLGYKYSRTGVLVDLEEAIRVSRQAVNTTPEDHPDRVARLYNLGLRLGDRYLGIGDVSDLEEAIQLARQALAEAPDDHPDYPGLLTNLGSRLGDQYSRTGAMATLEEATRYMRQAVAVTPSNHPGEAIPLNNLGLHLGERYLRIGAMSDLEEAIQDLRRVVQITPDDSPDQAAHLNNLGLQLGHRYARIGAMVDLDEAMQCIQQAVDLSTEDHPHWIVYMNNLGLHLGERYLRTGAIADLDEAIQVITRAIDATPGGHPSSAALLTNLGIQLSNQYSRKRAKADLELAIQVTRQGLDSTPEDHPHRIVHSDTLAILLGQKYSETRAIGDLEEAIEVARQAVDITPQDHEYKARVLNNLGEELSNLYLKTKDIGDLEEAITYLRQAVDIMPQDYSDCSALLGNLGDQLEIRYTKTGAMKDRQDALAYYRAALNQANSYTLSRIWAGRGVLRCAPDWQQAYAAASLTVSLVPRLSSRSLQNSDRQHALSQVVGLASDAAAVALQAGQTPLVALGLLEQGRCVLGASIEEIRSDILNLRERDHELAEQFVRLRDELETAFTLNPQLVSGNIEMSWQARTSRRYEARKEFDKLVAKIQKLPGFEDFLLPPNETEIKAAARCGPVVVINVSKYRCDTLLVEPHQIRALALTQLSIVEVEDKAWGADLGSYEVLEWLWDTVTQPILDALGFIGSPSSDESWPHRQLQPASSAQALLVAMEHTPGNDVLPFATKEVALVRNLCGSMSLQPVEPGRRKQDVESHLLDCKIFHFAGHGGTDEHDASNSRLILEDGTLRVAELLEMNLVEHSPFLAYLSACGTGRIKDERSVDESIHLMSAFQLAGFRHVIGTLWEVRDELCVDMGEDHVRRVPPDTEDGSSPSERAVPGVAGSEDKKNARSLRDVGAYDAGPALWAPYVHFGV